MADVAVIGGGPTGLSAALFLAKSGRRTVVVDTGRTLIKRADLRNYLGFLDGLGGYELLAIGRQQVERYGGEIVSGKDVRVEERDRGFVVYVDDRPIKATYLILATGMNFALAESLGLELRRGNSVQAMRVVVTDGEGRTSRPGIWAAGVLAGTPVQTIVAAGDGARVAINLLTEIRGSAYVDHDILPSGKKAGAGESRPRPAGAVAPDTAKAGTGP